MMVFKSLSNLFRQNCIFCKSICDNFDTSPVCSNCFNSLEIWGPCCIKCGKKIVESGICGECINNNSYFDFLFHIYSYEGKAKEVINLYKFKGAFYFANVFSLKMYEILKNLPENFINSSITFVPAHPYRILARNYNPVEYLAKSMSKLYGVPCLPTLKKIQWKKPQTSLSKEKREKNVKGTFKAIREKMPEKIILIDDIYTTGATIKECAKILKKAGIKNISGITLARTQ